MSEILRSTTIIIWQIEHEVLYTESSVIETLRLPAIHALQAVAHD